MRGACILTIIAQYRSKLCSGQLPLDVSGTKRKPLCSTGFKYQLHSCRIPMKYKDKFRLYDPSLHKHCIVACRGHYFSMDIVDENNNPLPLHELEMGLEHCIELAKAKPVLQFGFLTTTDRNSWANNREMLVLVGGERMIKALEKIESSAALICLDDTAPTSLQECAPIYWHGGHDPNMMNRWFDKPVQIICQNNGKAAYLAEHSMLDGMQVDKFCDQINKSKYSVLSTSIDLSNSKCTTKQMPFISNIFEDVVGSAIAYEKINHAIEKGKILSN
jgi:carnitine O-acetyltransferase